MASANAGEAAGKVYTLQDALCMVISNCLFDVLFLQQKRPARVSRLCAAVGDVVPFSTIPPSNCHRLQVAEQGLLPAMAIRACNNPDITSSVLSREISKAVAEHGARKVERRCRIQAASALVSVARGGGMRGRTGEDVASGRDAAAMAALPSSRRPPTRCKLMPPTMNCCCHPRCVSPHRI